MSNTRIRNLVRLLERAYADVQVPHGWEIAPTRILDLNRVPDAMPVILNHPSSDWAFESDPEDLRFYMPSLLVGVVDPHVHGYLRGSWFFGITPREDRAGLLGRFEMFTMGQMMVIAWTLKEIVAEKSRDSFEATSLLNSFWGVFLPVEIENEPVD